MKPFAATTAVFSAAAPRALPLRHLAGIACLATALAIVVLCCAPESVVKDWGMGLLDILGIDAPLVWALVLDAPKLWHVAVYAALTLALLTALPGRPGRCFAIALALGAALELAQAFTATRSARFTDLLYNLAGIGLAFVVYSARDRLTTKHTKRSKDGAVPSRPAGKRTSR